MKNACSCPPSQLMSHLRPLICVDRERVMIMKLLLQLILQLIPVLVTAAVVAERPRDPNEIRVCPSIDPASCESRRVPSGSLGRSGVRQ